MDNKNLQPSSPPTQPTTRFKAPIAPPSLKTAASAGLLPSKKEVSSGLLNADIKPRLAPPVRTETPLKTTPPPQNPALKTAPPTKQEIKIRTMKDDLDELRSQATPIKPKPSPNTSSQPVTTPPLSKNSASSISPRPQRTVIPPNHADKAKRRRKTGKKAVRSLVLTIVLLVTTLGGAGAMWWYFGDMIMPPASEENQMLAAASQVLPANYSLIVGYRLSSLSDRTSVAGVWQKQRGEASSEIAELISGDPRLVVDDTGLTEMYYVILPDSPRPYLLVPQTETTNAIFSEASSRVQATKYQGWYIAHPVATEKYLESVATNRLSTSGTDFSALTSTQSESPIRLLINASAIENITQAITGNGLGSAQLSQINLIAKPIANNTLLQFNGNAAKSSAIITNTVMLKETKDLLAKIPASASMVRLGGNFADDLRQWGSNNTPNINKESINLPRVRQLVDQLEVPYAFYIINKSAGERDFGLIIHLPDSYQDFMSLSDPALEEGLAALVPLLTGRQSVASVAFSDGNYQGINLRYANFSGSNNALDYAITNQYLVVGTSKDSMFELINTITQQTGSKTITSDSRFSALLDSWKELPDSHNLVIAAASYEYLSQIMPIANAAEEFSFSLASTSDASSPAKQSISGLIELGTNP